jgi:hypothetical protein
MVLNDIIKLLFLEPGSSFLDGICWEGLRTFLLSWYVPAYVNPLVGHQFEEVTVRVLAKCPQLGQSLSVYMQVEVANNLHLTSLGMHFKSFLAWVIQWLSPLETTYNHGHFWNQLHGEHMFFLRPFCGFILQIWDSIEVLYFEWREAHTLFIYFRTKAIFFSQGLVYSDLKFQAHAIHQNVLWITVIS